MGLLLLFDKEENKKSVEYAILKYYKVDVYSMNINELKFNEYKYDLIVFVLDNPYSDNVLKFLNLLVLVQNCIVISDVLTFSNPRITVISLVDFLNRKNGKVSEMISNSKYSKEDILIKIAGHYRRIEFKDLEYIKGNSKRVSLVLPDRKYNVKTAIDLFQSILPACFVQISQTHIVNTKKVKRINIDAQVIELENHNISYIDLYKYEIFNHFHVGISVEKLQE